WRTKGWSRRDWATRRPSAEDERNAISHSMRRASRRLRERSDLIGGCSRAANSRGLRMHSIHIAEWILRLVTSQDRAASAVGDLVEQGAARGMVWFWSCVLRTAASLLWRDLADHPVRVAAVALLGLAVDVVASLLLVFLSGLMFFVLAWGGH